MAVKKGQRDKGTEGRRATSECRSGSSAAVRERLRSPAGVFSIDNPTPQAAARSTSRRAAAVDCEFGDRPESRSHKVRTDSVLTKGVEDNV